MKMAEIEPGRSYACYFKATDLINENGTPVKKGDGAAKLGVWEGFGVIKTRDIQQELAEVVDQETGKVYVVGWEDCWGIDEVEWRDAD